MKNVFFRVVGETDEKTCESCREWIGQIVSMVEDAWLNGEKVPSVYEFMDSKAFHPNCRCSLRPLTDQEVSEMTNEEDKNNLTEMAVNTANFTDEIVYRGFIDALSEDEYDFGSERWCMIAPLGEYLATTADGREVKEILTAEDFERLVILFHDRQQEKGGVPLDKDHASMKKPLDRDTQAYGWIRDLRMMIGGASQYNGLYAKIEWTGEGRALVLGKYYRFLSPVFTMDENGHPTSLVNVALTNRPNFDLPPIFNSAGDSVNTTLVEEHTMDLEQLKNEIADKVIEGLKVVMANAKPVTETINTESESEDSSKDSSKEETKEVSAEEDSSKEDSSKEETKNECSETKNECSETETKNECSDKETTNETTDEVSEAEKEEVITEDVLNTVPTNMTSEIDNFHKAAEWQNLHGEALIEWARKNPQC